jgi:hypothetical protein
MRNFTNSVPVFREDFMKNLNSFKELFTISKGKKVFFGVFPEGQLNKKDFMDRIKKGAAYLSYKTKIPIVPVYIHNINKGLNLDSRLGRKPVWEGIFALIMNTFRRINVIIGDPIDPIAENIIQELKEIKDANTGNTPVDNINEALYEEFMELRVEADNLLKIKGFKGTETREGKKIAQPGNRDYGLDDEDSFIDSLDDEDLAGNAGNAK